MLLDEFTSYTSSKEENKALITENSQVSSRSFCVGLDFLTMICCLYLHNFSSHELHAHEEIIHGKSCMINDFPVYVGERIFLDKCPCLCDGNDLWTAEQ